MRQGCDAPLFIVQGSHQYMPSMHHPGMGHSSMQGMYNSAPQAIPSHMHPHSRSYPVDLGMNHHPMMDQVKHTVWPLMNKLKSNHGQVHAAIVLCCSSYTNSVSLRKPAQLTHHATCSRAILPGGPI